MTREELNDLLAYGESPDLDYKKDWPPELLAGNVGSNWDRGRGRLLKALTALANGKGSGPAYLIFGVKDLDGERKATGITKPFDDADFQQWVQNTFDPPIDFLYTPIKWSNTENVGVFQIQRIITYPHVVKTDVGGVLYKGQVWFRMGTKNNVALHADIKGMFKAEEPFKAKRLTSPFMDKIKDHYRAMGRELTLPLLSKKDELLDEGYELATWPPQSRREVWAGASSPSGGTYSHILLLVPREQNEHQTD